MLGPLFFTIYASPVINIAHHYDLTVHKYTDDTQLLFAFKATDSAEEALTQKRIELCVSDIKSWMSKSKT